MRRVTNVFPTAARTFLRRCNLVIFNLDFLKKKASRRWSVTDTVPLETKLRFLARHTPMAKRQQAMNYYEVLTSDIFAIIIEYLDEDDLLWMRGTCRAWETNKRVYARIKAICPRFVKMALEYHKYALAHKLITSDDKNDWRDVFGRSWLLLCMREDADMTIKALIAAGADINTPSVSGLSPLNLAMFQDNIERVEMLIEAKADLNQKDVLDQTPLMWAAQKNASLVRILLEAGADVHPKSVSGDTALDYVRMWADKFDFCKRVRLLLQAGAYVRQKDCAGETALEFVTMWADKIKYGELLRVVLRDDGYN